MSQEKVTYLLIKGAIADLPEVDRQSVDLAATKLREVVNTHNDHGKLALALVGAELAMED